ncbi:hypothetical protein [Luteibacter sp. UNCMF366Tsu5.1]|uniref:hypothetical protein n=1 Tax=Luteibacter sp. UNCMF366Tsu5.1 TaxID=1502758 RepID=UPI000908F558|nr:hypothetical protein [Luteibacter sp. UNCMF366Tsu5.1]SFW68588.1 hypothetical protein SAMN02800691_2944 [Luteibacter sp. UNCMF366Tsu5.1]
MDKHARFSLVFSLVQLTLAGGALAQSMPVLSPIPKELATGYGPRMESCDAVDCNVSAAQIRAFDKARGLYVHDAIAAPTYSIVFGQESGDIAVTFIPSPLGTRGRAVTYVFDASGAEMKRSYINR